MASKTAKKLANAELYIGQHVPFGWANRIAKSDYVILEFRLGDAHSQSVHFMSRNEGTLLDTINRYIELMAPNKGLGFFIDLVTNEKLASFARDTETILIVERPRNETKKGKEK